MKISKRSLIMALSMVLALSVSAFGTVAYMTDRSSVTNVFTIGGIDIEMDETKVDEDGNPIDPNTDLDDDGKPEVDLDGNGDPDIEIEVDGNVSFENAKRMCQVGADIFVAGSSSVFSKSAPLPENIAKLRKIIEEA